MYGNTFHQGINPAAAIGIVASSKDDAMAQPVIPPIQEAMANLQQSLADLEKEVISTAVRLEPYCAQDNESSGDSSRPSVGSSAHASSLAVCADFVDGMRRRLRVLQGRLEL